MKHLTMVLFSIVIITLLGSCSGQSPESAWEDFGADQNPTGATKLTEDQLTTLSPETLQLNDGGDNNRWKRGTGAPFPILNWMP